MKIIGKTEHGLGFMNPIDNVRFGLIPTAVDGEEPDGFMKVFFKNGDQVTYLVDPKVDVYRVPIEGYPEGRIFMGLYLIGSDIDGKDPDNEILGPTYVRVAWGDLAAEQRQELGRSNLMRGKSSFNLTDFPQVFENMTEAEAVEMGLLCQGD